MTPGEVIFERLMRQQRESGMKGEVVIVTKPPLYVKPSRDVCEGDKVG